MKKIKNNKIHFLKNSKGFTLVEVLVAISIFTFSVLALLVILSQGISSTNSAKQKIIGTYLAQEGIEYVRNARDNYMLFSINGTWSDFTSTKIIPCFLIDGCSFDDTITTPSLVVFSPCVSSGSAENQCELYVNSNGKYHYINNGDSDSGFNRSITAVINGDELTITSKVTWLQGSGAQSVSFTENLFNWSNSL
ncbi:MAG: prepilin-type N-terminal cleavage/methylation domain-containing protein [Candidatus Nomurabacteria bacterium]|nr:prepilin-type N-terminal cleavage/methylation domain-containing protein [Candidatus Nomurabacteria bacterium]